MGEVRPDGWERCAGPVEEPGPGRFAGRTRVISLDPAMRGRLDDRPSCLPPVAIGEVMRVGSVIEVAASDHPDFQPGDHVEGCRVVGVAGGPEKCALLTDELGFDAAIDYRADDVRKALHRHAPDGIDVHFDNVGGDTLDAALTRPAMHARVVACGAIGQYSNATPVKGPSNYLTLLVRRARMEGFVVFDHAKRYPQAAQDISAWIADGRIKVREHVVGGGVDDFPETLQTLFRGENVGKLVLEPA
ncbi:zinc-binding dehydrogenase [Streptomyces populi]|uniref:zinc-binding dehydrogenase n=1 Tax=Streptomyces populi TaxID=2058924 RepID=UPI0035E28DAA